MRFLELVLGNGVAKPVLGGEVAKLVLGRGRLKLALGRVSGNRKRIITRDNEQ